MRQVSFDDCYPLDRSEFKSQIAQGNISQGWLVACNENEFAIGIELDTGAKCVLATQRGTLLRFRQFEGAHKELFAMGIHDFKVNAERWDIESAYNRWKAQYEVKRRRDNSIYYC